MPGDNDLWTFLRFLDLQDASLDALVHIIFFARDLFLWREHGFCLVQLDVAGALLDAVNDTADDLRFLAREFVVDDAAFCFADALHDNLLCCLRGDAAEILRILRHIHNVAELGVELQRLRILQGDLRVRQVDIFNDFLFRENVDVACLRIHLDRDVHQRTVVFLACRDQCSLDGFHDHGGIDPFFFFQLL